MAVTSWKYPTSAVSATITGDNGDVAWTTPGGVAAESDAQYAQATLNAPSLPRSRTLSAYGFNFASDIPAGSIILGIEVDINRITQVANAVCDYALYLVTDGTAAPTSTRIGSNRATATPYPTGFGKETHGGSSDLWGATPTAAMVRDPNFGLHLQAYRYAGTGGVIASIDSIAMRITYLPPVTGTASITEGADTAAGAGAVKIRGAAAITEAADGVASTTGYSMALDLDFLPSEVPDPRITWTGGVNGTRVNSAGVIVAASAPRYDYDPVTLLPRGVLGEDPRTNILLNSLLNGTSLSTQSVTVTAVPYTLSFYGTGSIALSGAYTGTLNGTGAYPARTVLTFTPTAGTLTLTVTGSVQFANLEAGSWATSFIPTGASAVTRTAEISAMTGSNFSSWFNPVEGTFVVEYDVISLTSTSWIVAAHSGPAVGTNDYIGLVKGSGNQNRQAITAAGVSQGTIDVAGSIINTPMRLAGAYKANDAAASVNGGTPGTDPTVTLPTPNALSIGYLFSQSINGHIRRIRYYNQRLPNAILQALTTTITGAGAITEANDNAAGAGRVKVQGQASITEAADTVAGAGEVGIPLATPRGRVAVVGASRLSNRTAR